MAVTLKDIALEMGVTPTTVHKALRGKEGVSPEMRTAIQEKAAQMGYRSNYMAAALKRKTLHLAVVMPETSFDNKYYYGNLWSGIRTFLQEVDPFGLDAVEYTYPLEPGANGELLQQLYESRADELDGIVTVAVEHDKTSYFLHKFARKGVPVALIGADPYPDARFCCVKTRDETAGSLAAELLTGFNLSAAPQKIILTGHYGPLGMRDQYFNAQGFLSYLRSAAPHYEVLHIQGPDSYAVQNEITAQLTHEPDISAIYSCSARYTVRMAAAVQELGLEGRIRLIGNDRFEESLQLLGSGVLNAIIDKKVAQQSYLAIKTLFDYLLKNEYPPQDVLYVEPEIMLRSSLNGIHDPGGSF